MSQIRKSLDYPDLIYLVNNAMIKKIGEAMFANNLPNSSQPNSILSVDIGGTNCRLANFQIQGNQLHLHQKQWLSTAKMLTTTDFLQACSDFMPNPQAVIIAVAGPVQSDIVKVTNSTLALDLVQLKTHFQNLPWQVINDFVAQAYAVLVQPGQQATLLYPKVSPFLATGTTHGILGAGTGFGSATLYHTQNTWLPLPSELGHVPFAFNGSEEFRLQDFIKQKTQSTQVNYDDILTGKGLSLLHEFLTGQVLTPAQISEQALTSLTPTLNYFATFYARACRTWMLCTLCHNLYLAGGIAAHNPLILQCPAFAQELYAAKTHASYVAKTPIWLIADMDSGLWGCAYLAQQLLAASSS